MDKKQDRRPFGGHVVRCFVRVPSHLNMSTYIGGQRLGELRVTLGGYPTRRLRAHTILWMSTAVDCRCAGGRDSCSVRAATAATVTQHVFADLCM
jgi:hypothetical protein